MNSEVIDHRLEAHIPTNDSLCALKIAVGDVDDPPTLQTHKVMMRWIFYDLVLQAPPTQVGLAQEAQIPQRLQCTIHCGEIQIPEGRLYPNVDFFGAQVRIGGAQSA